MDTWAFSTVSRADSICWMYQDSSSLCPSTLRPEVVATYKNNHVSQRLCLWLKGCYQCGSYLVALSKLDGSYTCRMVRSDPKRLSRLSGYADDKADWAYRFLQIQIRNKFPSWSQLHHSRSRRSLEGKIRDRGDPRRNACVQKKTHSIAQRRWILSIKDPSLRSIFPHRRLFVGNTWLWAMVRTFPWARAQNLQ